ncbi:facilitated trehalose transporter Tret1-like isoform X2 [Vespa mandarinia]|uniref:facilitated trehalose transporter Tret1-like isoform X2 n=1 Tax=Vespa mandarinia TaxID=7446 RepID=UPI00160E957D|nr:facilitated trehalose transporter Tret1-like isoform X2 [Vespa mandarinia]
MNGDGDKGKYTSPHGSKTWEYLAIFVCTVLTLCVGILFGWNSPTVVLLLKPNSPVPVTISDISTLTVSLMLAQMLAPFINMFAIDKIGRKYALLFCGLPIVATWCLIIVAKSVSVLYVARFFSGISVGLVFIITPMYLGEISSIKTRGVNGTLLGITSNLEKLRGKIDVSEELNMILESLKKKDENKGGNMGTLKEMFMIKGNRRAFLIILLFVTCNHFSGYITMIIYGQLIFKETSSRISHYTENIIVGIILLLSSILIIFFVDKLGRKPLIFVSGIIIGFCNLTIGSFFYVKDYINENISTYFLIPLIAFIILIFFSNSMFNLMLIMVSEIFSIEVKAFSSCVIGIAGGLFGTIVSKLYIFISISLNYGHSVPFYGFCIIIWITIFILFNLVPETKGKTFQDIQRELNK